MAGELRRLGERDRWLLGLLAEHQVLTTAQIAGLGFSHPHTARNRLALLHSRDVLIRFRDLVRPGSQSWRWCLGPIGAAYIANRDGQPVPTRATTLKRADRLSTSPRLAHLLGVNAFFTDLAIHARTTGGDAELQVWWSENACRRNATGELVRPDGHGAWREGEQVREFWLEYDRATEDTSRVVAKLDGYARLHRATGLGHVICYQMQTRRQETELTKRLAAHPAVASGLLTVATMSEDGHPAGTVWQVAGSETGHRRKLIELPSADPRR
ncbi:replication-relaxation family protein [Longispora albida]|uniref:replication-relaxation family protein n=1 Tax=Longispora albida TaxID=203523 RepID=UPI0003659FBF|nr:replication-relaxation family protein [Longispora albida]